MSRSAEYFHFTGRNIGYDMDYRGQDDETPDAIIDNDNVLPTSNAPLLASNNHGEASSSLLFTARTNRRRRGKVVLGAFYAVQVFYSFMVM
ncbi:hypothetical protein ACJ72_03700 [Emergomyces africanus]|uniref:Uncharacterized protein n=1 Tax=Emergomyces africanus TaxID=1955775 RepID=A0A1B7NYU2_9EURO|nr:hypothetical protein ACJ72_03700 [Emergomyces africanus]